MIWVAKQAKIQHGKCTPTSGSTHGPSIFGLWAGGIRPHSGCLLTHGSSRFWGIRLPGGLDRTSHCLRHRLPAEDVAWLSFSTVSEHACSGGLCRCPTIHACPWHGEEIEIHLQMIGVRCADDTCMPVDTMLVEWGFRLARIPHLGSDAGTDGLDGWQSSVVTTSMTLALHLSVEMMSAGSSVCNWSGAWHDRTTLAVGRHLEN